MIPNELFYNTYRCTECLGEFKGDMIHAAGGVCPHCYIKFDLEDPRWELIEECTPDEFANADWELNEAHHFEDDDDYLYP